MPSLMPSAAARLRRQALMRRRRRMGDEALGVAEIVGNLDDLTARWRSGTPPALPPSTSKATSVPPPVIWRRASSCCGWSGAAGIEHAARRSAARRENRRSCAALVVCWATRSGSVSRPFSSTQALKGDSAGPVWRRKLWICVSMNCLRAEDDAAEAAALAVDMLGRRIDDAVGAELQRLLQHRRGEDIVDDERRAGSMGDSAIAAMS